MFSASSTLTGSRRCPTVLAAGFDCAYIPEVAVHLHHRGRGPGTAVISQLAALPRGHKFLRINKAMAIWRDPARAVESGAAERAALTTIRAMAPDRSTTVGAPRHRQFANGCRRPPGRSCSSQLQGARPDRRNPACGLTCERGPPRSCYRCPLARPDVRVEMPLNQPGGQGLTLCREFVYALPALAGKPPDERGDLMTATQSARRQGMTWWRAARRAAAGRRRPSTTSRP